MATDFFFAARFSFLSRDRGYTEHLLSRPLRKETGAVHNNYILACVNKIDRYNNNVTCYYIYNLKKNIYGHLLGHLRQMTAMIKKQNKISIPVQKKAKHKYKYKNKCERKNRGHVTRVRKQQTHTTLCIIKGSTNTHPQATAQPEGA